MSTHTFFAYLAVAILAGLAVFQAMLAAGRPLGRFAWGGQHDVLPQNLRTGSLVSILLYAVFAVIILERARLLSLGFSTPSFAIWALAIYFTLGVFMNAISRSKPERNVMTPVALLLAACCYALATG
ncbi:MAG: hypothetical protein KIT70_09300 [Anaerolineales bacterium]|nr:MAG: hypothetical protein KIT70_09300 [Anaerolineales bacterium]